MGKSKLTDGDAQEEASLGGASTIDGGQGRAYPGRSQRARRPPLGHILDDAHPVESYFLFCNQAGTVFALVFLVVYMLPRVSQSPAPGAIPGAQIFVPVALFLGLVHAVSEYLDVYWLGAGPDEDVRLVVALGPATWVWRSHPLETVRYVGFRALNYRLKLEHGRVSAPQPPIGQVWLRFKDGSQVHVLEAREPAEELRSLGEQWAGKIGVEFREGTTEECGVLRGAPRSGRRTSAGLLACLTILLWLVATYLLLSRVSPTWWQA